MIIDLLCSDDTIMPLKMSHNLPEYAHRCSLFLINLSISHINIDIYFNPGVTLIKIFTNISAFYDSKYFLPYIHQMIKALVLHTGNLSKLFTLRIQDQDSLFVTIVPCSSLKVTLSPSLRALACLQIVLTCMAPFIIVFIKKIFQDNRSCVSNPCLFRILYLIPS